MLRLLDPGTKERLVRRGLLLSCFALVGCVVGSDRNTQFLIAMLGAAVVVLIGFIALVLLVIHLRLAIAQNSHASARSFKRLARAWCIVGGTGVLSGSVAIGHPTRSVDAQAVLILLGGFLFAAAMAGFAARSGHRLERTVGTTPGAEPRAG